MGRKPKANSGELVIMSVKLNTPITIGTATSQSTKVGGELELGKRSGPFKVVKLAVEDVPGPMGPALIVHLLKCPITATAAQEAMSVLYPVTVPLGGVASIVHPATNLEGVAVQENTATK